LQVIQGMIPNSFINLLRLNLKINFFEKKDELFNESEKSTTDKKDCEKNRLNGRRNLKCLFTH